MARMQIKKQRTKASNSSLSSQLLALIRADVISGSEAFIPIIRIESAEQASHGRARVSQTGADVELVRRGDRGAALGRLADRLSRGWIEAAWGGDPMKQPARSVLTPQPWILSHDRRRILQRSAAQARVTLDVMKREVLKSAVIAAIHDDERPVWRSLEWPIFGDGVAKGAEQIIGRLKPGEIDEWDVYVEWFHRRVLAFADQFVDEERETKLAEMRVDDPPAARTMKALGLSEPGPSAIAAREQRTLAGANSPRSRNPLGVMRSLVAVLVGEGPDSMKPVLISEAPRVVEVVRDAINAEICGITPEVRPATQSWAEKLWTCPPETRLGVRELAEAVGRPRSWAYRHASPKGDLAPIPHKRLDGLLTFTAGDVRTWLRANEEAR